MRLALPALLAPCSLFLGGCTSDQSGNLLSEEQGSIEIKVDGQIDLLFSDSEPTLREQEIRRFLPNLNPNGLILVHDASSHLKTVREAALKLEQEGAIASSWGVSDNNRKAKYYRLTRAGKRQLAKETRNWEQTASILARFLTPERG